MKIYLVDYLGIHCGMDYYLEAFKNVLSNIKGLEVRVLSNFSEDGSKPFFINQYKGGIAKKGTSLLRNLFRLRKFVSSHPDDVFIYLSYGNQIDIPFMKIIAGAKHHIIDIHEGIAQNIDSNQKVLRQFKNLYSNRIKTVISHSERTDKFLEKYEFKGKRFNVPHFRYVMPKTYDLKNIPELMQKCIFGERTNLLFFGNLNENKGVDVLIEAFNILPPEAANKLNLIIAGKDFDSSVYRVKPKSDRSVNIFVRHITDDELRFLYANTDYICLPYRKTSQSGILEMALYFKKPIIATDIPYFKMILDEFPSFGILAGNNAKEYAETLRNISEVDKSKFFSKPDLHKYENRPEILDFKKDFADYLSKLVSNLI